MKTHASTHKRSLEDTMEGFFVQIDQWLSDLDFTSEEIQFFKKVLHHYIKGSEVELQEKIDEVEKEIVAMEQKTAALKSDLLAYRSSLEKESIQQTDIPLEILLNDNQINFQSRFNSFNSDMRSLKEDLFSITNELYGS